MTFQPMNDTNSCVKKVLTGSFAVMAMLGATTACDDGAVRFGPPGGLRIRGVASVDDVCPLPGSVSPTPSAVECAASTWKGEIFPRFFDAGTPYLCANAGCHAGPDDPTGVNMVIGDAAASYSALANFSNGGRPYFSEDPADAPYLLCNIDAGTSVPYGSPMPKGPVVSSDDLAIIGLWVACGMVNDTVPGGGAGGGVGGMGAGGGGGAAGQ